MQGKSTFFAHQGSVRAIRKEEAHMHVSFILHIVYIWVYQGLCTFTSVLLTLQKEVFYQGTDQIQTCLAAVLMMHHAAGPSGNDGSFPSAPPPKKIIHVCFLLFFKST